MVRCPRAPRTSPDPDNLDGQIRDIAWRSPTSLAVLQPVTPELVQVRSASVDGATLADPPVDDRRAGHRPDRNAGRRASRSTPSPSRTTRTSLADLAGPRGERIELDPGLTMLATTSAELASGSPRRPRPGGHVQAGELERCVGPRATSSRLVSTSSTGRHAHVRGLRPPGRCVLGPRTHAPASTRRGRPLVPLGGRARPRPTTPAPAVAGGRPQGSRRAGLRGRSGAARPAPAR